MTKDEIMQALRLTAMGRAGHPLQEDLAEKLAEVFSYDHSRDKDALADVLATKSDQQIESVASMLAAHTGKRGPGRPKKAE